ncbi:MAG: hypothetical protein K8J09_08405 [Planctomycetes bacterium]|nr:hypothetical protein [Planctomycetota bacterium]MCC7398058.1 HEAT repeat domain-containing protein [Planctomycetota bacterium]
MLAALLVPVLLWQEPEPPPTPPPTPKVETPAPAAPTAPVVVIDDAKAKVLVAEFTKSLKGTPSMAQKTQALQKLAGSANKLLVKPLAQVVETDKSIVVRKHAAQLLVEQPAVEANPTVRKLLRSARVGTAPTVMAELVRGLVRCGYEQKQWPDLADLFEQTWHPDRVPLQEALLDLVIATKEKQAIPLLLRNLDAPEPKDPNAPDNPPAEYWKARWESWAVWKGKVKDALFALTGQRFSTAAEAEAWLKKNPG